MDNDSPVDVLVRQFLADVVREFAKIMEALENRDFDNPYYMENGQSIILKSGVEDVVIYHNLLDFTNEDTERREDAITDHLTIMADKLASTIRHLEAFLAGEIQE